MIDSHLSVTPIGVRPCNLLLSHQFSNFAGVVNDAQACGPVEDLAPIVGRVIHAGGAGEQAWLGLELAVCRKGHPEMAGVEWCGHVLSIPFWRNG